MKYVMLVKVICCSNRISKAINVVLDLTLVSFLVFVNVV